MAVVTRSRIQYSKYDLPTFGQRLTRRGRSSNTVTRRRRGKWQGRAAGPGSPGADAPARPGPPGSGPGAGGCPG